MKRALVLAATATLLAAGCGSSSDQKTVSVLYAGSLVNLMEHDLGPAFARATGNTFLGLGAGSTELVAQIKGKVRQGDVFISASPKANAGLIGATNGNWVSWYITFAKAPLVLGYNPQSRFASQLRSRPWYRLITQAGIRVGRTDPVLDPKGKLTVEALKQAGSTLHLPALTQALSSFPVFPEESLVGRLESGQLDAGFFYINEATERHIPTVPLTGTSKSATYTVTVLARAPHAKAAQAFVAYLLGPSGRATLQRHGLTLVAPRLTGQAAALPASLRALVSGQ
jgi:molybdate/tungstate transport system substrate-binding protein